MSATAPAVLARIEAQHAAVLDAIAARDGDPGREARRAAFQRFAAAGVPANREENWRYANLRALERSTFSPRVALDAATLDAARAALPAPHEGFARLVIVDGHVVPELCSAPTFPWLAQDAPDPAVADDGARDLRLRLLAQSFALQPLAIDVVAGSALSVELVLFAASPATTATAHSALRITVKRDATLRLIERQLSLGDLATVSNSSIDLSVGVNATVQHSRMQALGTTCHLFDTLDANVDTDAMYELSSIAWGALAARTTQRVRLAGERSRVRLASAVVLDGLQVNDTYARIEHAAPHTTTDEDFRGIAGGRSRAAFNGHIVMRPGASGAVSRQSLRSLLAGPGAEADARPQLEIYTDDVQASHGATAGKLDDTMLFYLLSRGIGREQAESLLKWAFIAELVGRLPVAALRTELEQSLSRRFTGHGVVSSGASE
jgi:Fe-S cluster assembly protein SufD